MNVQLDSAMQALDPNAQRVIVDAAMAWARTKETADPVDVAPANAGRAGDEQVPAPVDKITLIDTITTNATTTYEVEVSIGGNLDHINVVIADDGTTEVRAAE
jgi:hypothetical protein